MTETTSSSKVLVNGKIDLDTTNIYSAFDTETLAGIYIVVLAQSGGAFVGSVRQRESSQHRVGSIYAVGSSVVYISSYSTSTAYTELIKYDSSSSDYTIYEQTGLNFRFQFINTALNDCWYALVDTEYAHLSQLSTMDEVTGLTVNVLTNTGLTTETTTNGFSTSGSISLSSSSFLTTPTNAASDFAVGVTDSSQNNTQTNTTGNNTTTGNSTTTTTNTNSNSDDDSLSTVAIVFIIIGAVVAFVILAGVVFCIIKYHRKPKNTRGDMSRVVNPADESNVLKEETKV